MLLDINTWVGPWPFRRLDESTVGDLLKRLDRKGIDRAIVGPTAAALYRDPHGANEELHRQVRRHTDRLLPVGTLRPAYPGWEEDLRRCHEDFGFVGLRLLPQYHEYRLTDEPALDLVDAADERGFFLQVPQRIEDRRTRHPWDLARDLGPDEFVDAVKARPAVRWMFLNALGLPGKRFPAKARYVVDISRMAAVLQRNMQQFLDEGGNDRLAFGTGMLFKVAEPALLKLEILDRGKRVRDGIASRNAAKLIGLKG
jgi:predicted TIM-barrel fold metal-dependent hydrolase